MTAGDAKRPPLMARVLKSRWFVAIVAAFVLAGIAAFIALPLAIKYALKRELKAMGGEVVTVGRVGFNPFTSRLSLEDLLVRRDGADGLKAPKLEARLRWTALWKKRMELETVKMDGASVVVERLSDGSLRVGGLTGRAQKKEETKDGGKEWGVGIESLLVTESGVEYRSGGFKGEKPGARTAEKEGPGEAEKAVLDDLAGRRAAAIKDYLVEAHGVPHESLFLCNPAVDDSRGARPRVELLI